MKNRLGTATATMGTVHFNADDVPENVPNIDKANVNKPKVVKEAVAT